MGRSGFPGMRAPYPGVKSMHGDAWSATASADASPGAVPSAADVRAELARLSANPGFDASERRLRFLQFIVDKTLAGKAADLKGFSIAMEVFGRDETFDSQTDPVVRLEARRLRRDLDSFYIGPGAGHPLRISIPKGGYVPQFDWLQDAGPVTAAVPSAVPAAETPATPVGSVEPASPATLAPGVRRYWRALALGLVPVAALALAFAVFAWNRAPAPSAALAGHGFPRVIIDPFVATDGSDASRAISAGLGSEVLFDLSKFGDLRLYQSDGTTVVPPAPGAATYLVKGDVVSEDGMARIVVRLLDAASGELIWSEGYDVPLDTASLIGLRQEISARIATTLGQPYGPLADDLRSKAAAGAASSLESHLCVLRSYGYRRNFSPAERGPVRVCLEASVARDPTYADAWAMLGWLYLDTGRFDYGAAEVTGIYAKGADAAERALALDPDNLLALKALASIRHYEGDYGESETLIRRALALNPYDPDTLAQLGWRLAVRGRFDEGVPYLLEAIDRSVAPPGWYSHLVLIRLYQQGEFARMLAMADLASHDGSQYSLAMASLAALRLGDADRAARSAARIPATSILRRDPEAFFHRHHATDAISAEMSAALRETFAATAAMPAN